MALDIKFGVYVNLGSFNSIMKRYEKKKMYVEPCNVRTMLVELELRHKYFLTASLKFCVVLTLRKIEAYITCLK